MKSRWHTRTLSDFTINRAQAAWFLALVILPLIICLVLLERRCTNIERMMDSAVQGIIMQQGQ